MRAFETAHLCFYEYYFQPDILRLVFQPVKGRNLPVI